MLLKEDIKIEFSCQGFESQTLALNQGRTEAVLLIKSTGTGVEYCPKCGSRVHIYDSFQINLKDIPIWHGVKQTVCVLGYRYRCTGCEVLS